VRQSGVTSIRSFQVGRWRLRRTRQLWILNAVLVLPYYFSAGIPSCRLWRAQHGNDRTPDLFCEQEWFGHARNLTLLGTRSVRRASGLLDTVL
jgi:hypothetical protein